MNPNGSLSLTPIAVDGRQLLSSPCDGSNSVYTRYNQTELFQVCPDPTKSKSAKLTETPQRYEVLTDPYHGILRMNLYRFDDSPMNPMYIAYSPPEMLPTTTLNPLHTSTASAGATAKAKRGLEAEAPLAWKPMLDDKDAVDLVQRIDTDRLWWIGLSMTGVGGLLYLGPRRMGIRL